MIILLLLVGTGAMFFIFTYNGLIVKKNAVENAFGSLDALLKKRYDLVPNLVAVIRQYSKYEQETLEKVTALRSQAASGSLASDEKTRLSNEFTPLLRNILITAEQYPDLKANVHFTELTAALRSLEQEIAGARTGYNGTVTGFNNSIEMFPGNFVAGLMGLQRKPLFEAEKTERENVNLSDDRLA